MRDDEKQHLIEMCALVTSCIRDYNSLYRQYRACIYNEPDIHKPKKDRENLFYRYNELGIKMLSQRPIMVVDNLYVYMYKECLLIIVGNYSENSLISQRIVKYIHNYKTITSHICPTVVWCCPNVYIEKHIQLMSSSIQTVDDDNIFHDAFVVGNIGKIIQTLDTLPLRKMTCIALIEEKAQKKRYIILDGYGFEQQATLMDYFITIMNRVSNIRLDDTRKKSILM